MTEATAPVATEPDPPPAADEVALAHDGPTFVHNGIIRFPMGAETVRVRRPFLGELKELRLALQEVQDHLTEESSRVGQVGLGYQNDAKALREQMTAGKLTPAEHAEQLATISELDRRTARELDDLREQAMLDWWSEHVFRPLALDPVPDQMLWPMWMLDRLLPGRCLQHWRTVPTGPG